MNSITKFYQYTLIDEASRERFIYAYKEQSSYSTIDFTKRAIIYFGYAPEMIQTDNGSEFTHIAKTNRIDKRTLDMYIYIGSACMPYLAYSVVCPPLISIRG